MTSHTKGPWIAAPYSSVVGAPVVSTTGRPVAKVVYFQLGEGFENHERESIANGRLIAAAPQMIEALQKIASLTQSEGLRWWQVEARKAIALAMGDTPPPQTKEVGQ